MVSTWGSLLAELIALALVVALSPLSVVPAVVLVLQSSRPKAAGLAYLSGWFIGLLALTVLFVEVPRLLGDLDAPAPRWATWARVLIGVVLLIAGAWRWATRQNATGSPAWLNRVSELTPARAGAIGLMLTLVNPKVVVVCAAAGLTISTAELGVAGTGLAVALYTVFAGSTVVVPVCAHAVAADRFDHRIQRAKDWLERRHAVITAVILAVVGVVLLWTGIHELTASSD